MALTPLQYFFKENDSKPECLLIWLHGLGADGYDFEPLLNSLDLSPSAKIRVVFPHAPERPVTLNEGMVMRAWYDVIDLNRENSVNLKDAEESCRLICDLIEEQRGETQIPYERILIGGFSQGGAMALHFGLRFPIRIMGIISLSGYFFSPLDIRADRSPANQKTPVFFAHGKRDPVIPYELALRAEALLSEIDQEYQFKPHQEEHNVPLETLHEMSIWLKALSEGGL